MRKVILAESAGFCYGVKTFTEYGDGSANLFAVEFFANRQLGTHDNIVAVLLGLFVNLVGKRSGGRSLLGGVGEGTEAVKARFLDELAKFFKILFRLTRETDNGGGAKRDARHFLTQFGNRFADEGAVAVAVHGGENFIRDVLNRDIHVLE